MKDVVTELVAICRVFGVFERQAVCCGAVTVPQCVALQALLDGDHDVGRLAAHLGASTSAMTRLVDGLERRGWVRRERGTDDRRRVDLVLTPEGRREARRLHASTLRGVAAVLGRIPKDQQAQVLESLRLIREALQGAGAGLSCCTDD